MQVQDHRATRNASSSDPFDHASVQWAYVWNMQAQINKNVPVEVNLEKFTV